MKLQDLIDREIRIQDPEKSFPRAYVRLHNGNGCMVHFKPEDTIADLLGSNPSQLLQLPKSFKVLFQGKEITNFHKNSKDIGLHNQSILYIESLSKEDAKHLTLDIGIFYEKDRIYIRMKTEETLRILKNKLEKVTQVLVENQRLFFRGEELEDKRTIASYGMRNDSLICLIDRLKYLGKTPFAKKSHPLLRVLSDISVSPFLDEVGTPKKLQYGSFRMNPHEKDLGFEIQIKTKDPDCDEQETEFSLNQHEFKFNFLAPKEMALEYPEDNLRSTKSEDESIQKQFSPLRTDSLDSFSDQREMII